MHKERKSERPKFCERAVNLAKERAMGFARERFPSLIKTPWGYSAVGTVAHGTFISCFNHADIDHSYQKSLRFRGVT